MAKNVAEQLYPSKCICQRQVTFRSIIIKLPNELIRKRPIVVLLNLGIKLLHPPNFDEKFGEVLVTLLSPYSLLNTVSKFVVAVLFPQFINVFKVLFWYELGFREEDIATFLCRLTSENYEQPAGFLIGFAEVLVGEVLLEEVEGEGLGSGGSSGGGGGDGVGSGGC